MKKITALLLSAPMLLGACALTACGDEEPLSLKYYDYKGSTVEYNRETVYQNDLKVLGADPSAIYISEGEQAGYYYMYFTSDDIGASGYQCYRSKNLNDWECMGVAYVPTLYCDQETGITYSSFASSNFWAPEVIYDSETKLYYMFYNASYLYRGLDFYLDVAISSRPNGPFVQYAEWIQTTDASQEEKDAWKPVRDDEAARRGNIEAGKLYINKPLFDFAKMNPEDPLYEADNNGYLKVIDASPFVDPVTGQKYMYFVRDLGGKYQKSVIYGMELNDDWTPALDENGYYKTVKQLTDNNRLTVGGAPAELNEGDVNEGPFTIYNKENGKYYLTFSVNGYKDKMYQVRLAVADSPLGDFKKLTREEGGYVLYAEGGWTWASGTGHHSFVTVGDQIFIVYHAHTNRVTGGNQRAIAFDEMHWATNGNGLLVPHANGPTFSYMPNTVGEWNNIAPEATVSSTNVAEGSDVKYLNDKLIAFHGERYLPEFQMNAGSAEITLEFDEYREIKGLFIFNSCVYEKTIGAISSVKFDSKNEKGRELQYVTGKLEYDWDKYYTSEGKLIPGGNFAIEFAPMQVKKITISISGMQDICAFADIMVLGK